MGRPKLYVPIPVGLLESDAEAITIAVYAALKMHTDYGEETGAHPSDATLARLAGCGQRSVAKAREYLQKHGWIDWTSRRGQTNRYIVRNEPSHPAPGNGAEPPHEMQRSDGEQMEIATNGTPAPDAEVAPGGDGTPAPHAEVGADSEGTSAPHADPPLHHVQTTECPDTEVDTTSTEEPSSQQPPRTGEAPPPPPKGELTMEPDRDQAVADANDAMREIQEEVATEFLDSDHQRRRLKAAVEIIIGDPLSHWRNPHTGETIPPADRPRLLRTAILHHLAEPAHNLRASLRYTLKAELDPYNVPEDSPAATAREREARANGTPTSDEPVNTGALARVGANAKTIQAPKSPVERRIERAQRFRQDHPDRYVEIRDAAESAIRDRHTPGELRAMPDRILEGMVLNEIDTRIQNEEA